MKLLRWLAPVVLLTISCSEETPFNPDRMNPAAGNPAGDLINTMEAPGPGRSCASYVVLQAQLQADPSLGVRMNEIEKFTEDYVRRNTGRRLVGEIIEIPVHVNILYANAAENVSAEQIQSQIDVLNEDFAGTNADVSKIPSIFSNVFAKTNIRFVLSGTTRLATTKRSWRTNDDMKKASRGGINPTSPSTTLNIWVCTLANGILGYAQFPGGSPATDGVVILNTAFGRVGTAKAPYGLGRTATHEVGHYLNLRHIWGDATCGNDFVADTPVHNTSNGGCPAYPHYSTCSGAPIEMTMNYMDYTYDACMFMFTSGQKTRMMAIFDAGAFRNSMAQP